MIDALNTHDVDGAFVKVSDAYEYDDRRRLSGDPIRGSAELRIAIARIYEQYDHSEWRTIRRYGVRVLLLEPPAR